MRSTVRKRTWPPWPATRAGYTLIELVIVVALLSLILTLTLPALRKLSEKHDLQNAARQLRVTLLEARLAAVESGVPMLFQYQPGSPSFEVGPAALPAAEQLPADDPALNSSPNPDRNRQSQTLPRGIWFAAPTTGRPLQPSATRDDPPTDAAWSAPLLFYPNGRTRNARIALFTRNYRAELDVRGLTGTIQVSAVERLPAAEESPDALPEVAP